MPENKSPATQPEPGAAPGELNFAKSASENPRLKRRSLKGGSSNGKPAASATQPAKASAPQPAAAPVSAAVTSLKPASEVPSAALELVREAPPITREAARSEVSQPLKQDSNGGTPAAVRSTALPTAPPKTGPLASAAKSSQTATVGTTPTRMAKSGSPTASAATTTSSPHGTRPATLYYSSGPSKEKETIAPMKTIPTSAGTATSATASPASTATLPSSAARATTTSSSPRPSATVDYRANIDRQAREQKSVGNILAYVVYALIACFVLGGSLAGYGVYVLSKQIAGQNVTIDGLQQHFEAENKDLGTKLASTQDTLAQAQAQIARQQDLIVKQQEALNQLMAATTDNANAVRQEKQTRAQETASLRSRLRDVEYKQAQATTQRQ